MEMVRATIKHCFALLFMLAFVPAMAQTPAAVLYKEAEEILTVGRQCDSALVKLQQLTAIEKETGRYYELMGRVYECKQNMEYANLYYEQARRKGVTHNARQPGNDTSVSVSSASAELSKEREKLEARNYKYKNVKHRNVDDFYFLTSLGYLTATGGRKAMNVDGISFSFSCGLPVIHDKFLVDFTPTLGVIYGRADKWHDDVDLNNSGVRTDDDFNMGLLMGVEASMNYVLVNTANHTLVCGLCLGEQFYTNGAWITDKYGVAKKGGRGVSSTGPRLAYYGWAHLYVAAEYMHLGFIPIKATIAENTKLVPVNLDQLRIDLGYRFNY